MKKIGSFLSIGLATMILAVAIMATGVRADSIVSIASGDWSNSAIWSNATTGATGVTPGSTDDIQILGGRTVTYDLSGSQTFSNIRVSASSTLGWKLVDGSVDTREMHLTGYLEVGTGGSPGDWSNVTIGGSFGGGTIEATDSFKLIFDTASSGFQTHNASAQKSERTSFTIAGFSPSNRNVEIAGAGGGTYGTFNFQGGRRGAVLQNAYLHDLTGVTILRDGYDAGSGEVSGNLFTGFSTGAYALSPGGVLLITGNIIQNVDNGLSALASGAVFTNNVLTRATRGGYGIAFPSYPNSGQLVANNTFSGYDQAIREIWRLYGITLATNTYDNSNYGIRWTNNGGGNDGGFVSVRDQFGSTTPNATYDLYLGDFNNGAGQFHLDGSVLASDANPLNEIYFKPSGRTNYVAWRDFDGVTGDYRIWTDTPGVRWGDLVFAPRTTDTLTLENQSAYTNATPTRLTLDQDAQVAGLVLDTGTAVNLGGFTLTTASLAGDGTIRSSASGGTISMTGNSSFAGVLDGSAGRLSKTGSGVLDLNGTTIVGTFGVDGGPVTVTSIGGTGTIDVGNGGALLVNGTLGGSGGPVTVSSGGLLGGTGTVNRAVSVLDGGTLAVGLSPGIMTFTAGLSLESNSVFAVDINGLTPGTEHDRADVTGAVSISNAVLQVSVGGAVPPNTPIEILRNDETDPILGFFVTPTGDVLGEGASFGQWQISYLGLDGLGNDVVLTLLIPEPSTILLLGLGLLVLAGRKKFEGQWRRPEKPSEL